jgi:alkylation response protein AidB-like acyl-CoA dehydrogenase
MTFIAGHAEPNESPLLHATIALAPKFRASADEIEQARHLPKAIVDGLKDAGIFGMAMPRAWGGPELDPLTLIMAHQPTEPSAMANVSSPGMP